MAFKKGESGNINGRTKGSNNKVSGELKNMLTLFLESRFNEVIYEWELLNGKDKLNFYQTLIKYVIPTNQQDTMSESHEIKLSYDYSKLTTQELLMLKSINEKCQYRLENNKNLQNA